MFVVSLLAWGQGEERGPTFTVRLDGTANQLGVILRFDPSVGYRFNRYAAIDAGIPLYHVNPSDSAASVLGPAAGGGVGNAHLGLHLDFTSPAITYQPSVTVTAPTGDKNRGLSTGNVTYDWNNLFSRRFGRVMPFGALGLANTVADTPFFVRPFTSKGIVGHFEGGALIAFAKIASIGASAYAIEPTGQQTVVSRIIPPGKQAQPQPPPAAGMGNGKAKGRGNKPPAVFETAPETTGPADILRDRGGSVWLTLAPRSPVDLYVGYSRSTTYALDTVFFGLGVNVGSVIRNRH